MAQSKIESVFTYGVNPHERITSHRLPEMRVLGDGRLSVNAYMDLYTGYQVSAAGSGRAVYVKHLTPLFTHDLRRGATALDPAVVAANEGRSFGCFVFRGLLTAEIVRTLLAIPAHTIAAERFASDAVGFLSNRDVQAANRGIVLVEADLPASSA